jgi:hypothetical protein
MVGTGDTGRPAGDKAARHEARDVIAAYHQRELRGLLERVREGLARLDAGELDEFELDDLIHHYKRSANELWKFCGSSGGHWQQAVSALTYARERGEEPDWWERGAPRRTH